MIILDTHIWRYYVDNDLRYRLRDEQLMAIFENVKQNNLGVSIISYWEIAKKVEKGALDLGKPLKDWLNEAVSYTGIKVIPLDFNIILDATSLPGKFHRDPMDQIIVATARVNSCKLVTNDRKIRDYI